MSATVVLNRWTGPAGSETKTDMASGTDLAAADVAYALDATTNNMVIQSSGLTYSYWASFRTEVTVSPDGTMNNFRAYIATRSRVGDDAAIGWLGQLANVAPNAGYRQATGTEGVMGDELVIANHDGLVAESEDPLLWTSGSPMSMAGSISNPATGDVGDFVVLQRTVDDTYPSTDALPHETLVIEWDET